jgi:hypothetical protein
MLRSSIFSKVTAYAGILASVIGLAFFVPAIGIFLLLISAVVFQIWFILIARRLYQLGQSASKERRFPNNRNQRQGEENVGPPERA